MSSLPKLPGFDFVDVSTQRFDLSQTFKICNGYKLPKTNFNHSVAKSVKFATHLDSDGGFDSRLIYGRSTTPSLPQYKPHFVLYDKKCLNFKAFFKQGVHDSPNEHYRIRVVNIVYFLEDDTITVMEPRIINSGLDQGRLVRRGKIPKSSSGTYWHWKDLAVGKNIAINGIVYHLVDCDGFTREYMLSQGLIMKEPEQMPTDPYLENRKTTHGLIDSTQTQISSADDKLGRFLKYNGKILKFDALWDDRDAEFGELQRCEVFYFLEDDTVTVKEFVGKRNGKEYPLLIKRIKLPKVWYDRPSDFPAAYLEGEYRNLYQPRDFLIGETIFVLGRKILLIDCDEFTRNYFKSAFCIVQKPAIVIDDDKKIETPPKMPPHDGFGSLEDTLQNTKSLIPTRPKQDVIRQILNAGKYLSYEMVMCDVHPEDSIRKFIFQYSLADSTCRIYEPPIRNSGFWGGRFLRNTLLTRPGSDRLNPDFYTPNDFYIGAVITIFGHQFKIVGADLRVYRYMQANPEKFSCETIDNMRNYMMMKGYLKEDIREEFERLEEMEKQEKIDKMVEESPIEKTELQECLEKFQIDKKDDKEQHIVDEPVITEKKDIPYGIKEVNPECPYPPNVKEITGTECKTEEEKQKASEFDTPENKLKKYYDGILRQQKALCDEKPKKSVTFAT